MAVHGGQLFLSEFTAQEAMWNQWAVSLGKSFEHLKRVSGLQHTRLCPLYNVVSENETLRHVVP